MPTSEKLLDSDPMNQYYSKSNVAGWSSLVARWAHNPKVAGSNPAPAMLKPLELLTVQGVFLFVVDWIMPQFLIFF